MKAHSSPPSADEILWQESPNVCRPLSQGLQDFLASIQLNSPFAPAVQNDGALLVFLEESCLKSMQTHAAGDILRERAGILCGRAYIDGGQLYINITAALPVDTVSDAAHFAFHETSWHAIWNRLDDNSIILGWYHTHPGMGVFLSATDLRTQRLHFSAPWQIAIVIDPVSGQSGVFSGAEGNRVSNDQIFVYGKQQRTLRAQR